MSNISETLENLDLEKNVNKSKSNILSVGLDIGTMNIVLSRSDSDEIKITRNVFLPLDKDEISISELTDINYIQSDDGDLYIVGEDAFKMANLFNKPLSRPMERGMISPKEINAIDILTLIIKNLFGDIKGKDVYCSYGIPAEPIDQEKSVIYHEKVFSRILGSLGINNTSVNEAMAIIYSEAAKEKFSAIAVSFGAGMSNIAIGFKGIEVLKFSTTRGGDWIDKSVAESLSIVQNRVTNVKERGLDLEMGFLTETDKKKKRILEALTYYYESLINYTLKKISSEFEEKVDIEVDEAIPFIISGGTSLPSGFLNLFKTVLSKNKLPIEISEVRMARNPLTAVSQGLLVKTMSDVGGK